MTERVQPEEFYERFAQNIRHELKSLPTASLGRIKTLDEDTRRATIETVPDGTTETNVPVATTFAGDGSGDISPLNPAHYDKHVRGIILYFHHPMDEQLSRGGTANTGNRDHTEDDCVFMPAQVWFDDDAVPDHDPTERRVDHPEGGEITIDRDRTAIEHPLGAVVELIGEQPEEPDMIGGGIMDDVEYDPAVEVGPEYVEDDTTNREWPVAEEETASRVAHPDGPAFTAVSRGLAFEDATNVTSGRFTDGERSVIDGPHQHFHLIEHGRDEYSLAGPQLSFREFIAWMTDSDRIDRLRNSGQHRGAQAYAENYLEWLEAEVGDEIDPTDADAWPDPEPMPTPEEQLGFLSDAIITPPPATASVYTRVAWPPGWNTGPSDGYEEYDGYGSSYGDDYGFE